MENLENWSKCPKNCWYIALLSNKLRSRPVREKVMGTPLVFFRNSVGEPQCLVDRCLHRSAPLSAGRVVGDHIECRYHGWRYAMDGKCVNIPALPCPTDPRLPKVPVMPVREQDGFIWIYFAPQNNSGQTIPNDHPPKCPGASESGLSTHFHYDFRFASDFISVIENLLDFSHTSFVHSGNFRSSPAQPTTVHVRASETAVSFDFDADEHLDGILFRVLRWWGIRFRHTDRFEWPSSVITKYVSDGSSGFTFFETITPECSEQTRVYGCFTMQLPFAVPSKLLEFYLRMRGYRILNQDKSILDAVQKNASFFRNSQRISTRADIYRHPVERLLRARMKGQFGPVTAERIEVII